MFIYLIDQNKNRAEVVFHNIVELGKEPWYQLGKNQAEEGLWLKLGAGLYRVAGVPRCHKLVY